MVVTETVTWDITTVGDNVDKKVKPRGMRFSSQTTSLLYFQNQFLKS